MSDLIAQLQQENDSFAAQCERLDSELAQLRQEQERLQKSEARYHRQCFKNYPISTGFITNDGRPIEANLAFERKYGWAI